MTSRCKKIVTDIKLNKNIEDSLKTYANLLSANYNYYSTVKLCMNFYTLKETIMEKDDKNSDVCKYFSVIENLINSSIVNRKKTDEKDIEAINTIRNNVEYKMKILTAFTDGYEIFEYILNRIEAKVKDTVTDVDKEQLSAKMYQYTFCENDPVVINSKIQILMAQLPVRMTKNKFYDVISNTLSIYKGGEAASVDEFVDMLRMSALIDIPKGFDTEYPFLYRVYKDLEEADYKDMDLHTYEDLWTNLTDAADIIMKEVSSYMLMQEVINDLYTILLSVDDSYDINSEFDGYNSSISVIKLSVANDDLDSIFDELTDNFVAIEGLQEHIYENVMILETAFEDIKCEHQKLLENIGFSERFDTLDTISKLVSTSLFVDLDNNTDKNAEIMADATYIEGVKSKLIADFTELFKDKSKLVVRSIMCKILASMPVFFNSQQEIKDYFDYVLESCNDESELCACNKLICEIIEED